MNEFWGYKIFPDLTVILSFLSYLVLCLFIRNFDTCYVHIVCVMYVTVTKVNKQKPEIPQ